MDYQMRCSMTEATIFPPHTHKQFELILMLEGVGTYTIADKAYAFRAGTMAVVPPYTEHHSETVGAGKRICLQGNFESVFPTDTPFVFQDEENGECRQLLELILRNRFDSPNYVNALCHACLQWVVNHLHTEGAVYQAVQSCVQTLSDSYRNPQCDVTAVLGESGYAVDYIRACFKRIMGKTPLAFLTELRMQHACFLLEMYRDTLPLSRIAEQCGYDDYSQFSKTFKAFTGHSPRAFQKNRSN
jgi:AraC-like DNA-binding protein